MRAEWQALRAKLVKSSTTLAFQKDFESICGGHEVLSSFRDPADLFDRLHGPDEDHEKRNEILGALVREAQDKGPTSQASVTLLLLALWPGLDHAYGRLLRYFRNGPDELASELSARATQGILNLDLGRVNWIAATLIQNTKRDIRRVLQEAWARNAVTDEYVEDDETPSTELPSLLGLPASLDADTETKMITEWLQEVIGNDAALVVAIAVNGDLQHEAARRLGLTPEAARKRYQRAIAKLRRPLEKEFCA